MARFRQSARHPASRRSLIMAALYVVILIVVVLFGVLWHDEEPEAVYGSLDGRFTSDISLEYNGITKHYRENEITNYLIIGIDREDLDITDFQAGGQADFLLVLSVDRKKREITPVMIDRDAMTDVPTYGVFGNPAGTRTMQICLAQAFSGSGVSGSRNTAKAVSTLLGGIKIDRYVLMDLDGIVALNDAVGGVTVTLEDDFTMMDPAMQKGATVLLQGNMAEYFVRGRTTVADGTNASRMNRQKTYIASLLSTILYRMEEDDGFIDYVYGALEGHMESDTLESVLLNDVRSYKRYGWNELVMLPGSHNIGEDGFAEFWIDEQAAMDIVVDIWFE